MQRSGRLQRKTAHDLIIALAKYGNHYDKGRPKTDADVIRFFVSRGLDFDDVVAQCRDPKQSVPFFENLIGSTGSTVGDAKVSLVDNDTGDETPLVDGPGTFATSTYWALLETAAGHLERAIERLSYGELQSAIVAGIAAVEAYIAHRVGIWNKRNPSDLLVDDRDHKVSLDDKIDHWIPKMANGRKLDKGGQEWADFKKLRGIRDNLTIHPKQDGYGIRFEELADLANRFRMGTAGLLFQLHVLFQEVAPSQIIRARFAPDTVVVKREVPGPP